MGSARTILGVLTGLNALNYADRYVGAAMLPLIIAGLTLSDAEAGLLQSIFVVSFAFVSPLAGWLGDRWPRLPLAAAGVMVWSAATVASGLAPTYVALLLARAVIGVGEGSYTVITPSVLSDLYPAERRSRVFAIFYAAIPVGTALGYAVGGTVGSAFGWRTAFFVAGVPGALLALLLLALKEPRRGASDLGTAEPATPLRVLPSLRALWARRSYRYNTVAQILFTFAMGGLATWMPTYYVRERGLSLSLGVDDLRRPPARRGIRRHHRRRPALRAPRAPRARRRVLRVRLGTRAVAAVHRGRRARGLADGVLAVHVRHAGPALPQHRAAQRGDGERVAPRPSRAGVRADHDGHASVRRRHLAVDHRSRVGPCGPHRADPRVRACCSRWPACCC